MGTSRPSSAALPIETWLAIEKVRAIPLSYTVRLLARPPREGEPARVLVILGEAHMKLQKASELGLDLVRRFELRGVETFQSKHVFCGQTLGKLIHWPRVAVRKLSFGLVKDSTIVDAKALPHGHTDELERTDRVPLALHAASAYLTAFFLSVGIGFVLSILSALSPTSSMVVQASSLLMWIALAFEIHMLALVPAWMLRRYRWSVWIHPAIAIVNVRDTLMANGTARMLDDHAGPVPAITIMGRAHVSGYSRELMERHGFRAIDD